MTGHELSLFLAKYQIAPDDFAEMIGLTRSAVAHWLSGKRSIARPYGRLVRLFDKYPHLMREFK